MRQKINLRLVLIALIAVFTTAAGLTTVYYRLFQNQVWDDLRSHAVLLSDTELFLDADGGGDGDSSLRDGALERLVEDDLRITWIGADGTVLYDNDTDASALESHLDRPEVIAAFETGTGESVRRSETLNMGTYYYAILLENGTVLRVATEAHAIVGLFQAATPIILIILALIIALCIVLAHYLTAQLLRPIGEMAEQLDDTLSSPVYRELEPFADKIRAQHEGILSAARSRQDFTANVTHELKTPLTAISGYAELIESGMVEGEQVPHFASQIRRNAERLLSLINDIIRLSELDQKELPRRFESVDLKALAEDVCEDLRPSASRSQISLSCSGESAPLSADPDLIRELIENLVQNAIRYNRENGSVTVSVSCPEGRARLCVADTGIGIPEDQQSRVFERFYRVDKSRSRATGGTGLGLAIVKHIAEIHSAAITLESSPGTGTTITVAF